MRKGEGVDGSWGGTGRSELQKQAEWGQDENRVNYHLGSCMPHPNCSTSVNQLPAYVPERQQEMAQVPLMWETRMAFLALIWLIPGYWGHLGG